MKTTKSFHQIAQLFYCYLFRSLYKIVQKDSLKMHANEDQPENELNFPQPIQLNAPEQRIQSCTK